MKKKKMPFFDRYVDGEKVNMVTCLRRKKETQRIKRKKKRKQSKNLQIREGRPYQKEDFLGRRVGIHAQEDGDCIQRERLHSKREIAFKERLICIKKKGKNRWAEQDDLQKKSAFFFKE